MLPSKRFRTEVNARSLVEDVQEDVEALVPELEALLFPSGVPANLDLATLLQALSALLGRDLDALEGCERVLEAAQDAALERRREVARDDLRAALLRVRTLLMAAFGPRAVSACALSGPVPDAPALLIAYARSAVRALEQAAPAYTTPAPFVTMDLGGAAAFLRDRIDLLEILLHADDERQREAAAAMHERLAADWEHHLQASRIVIDALRWLVHRDPGRLRKRAVTEELPALPGNTAALGA
jgi:hypothetical protein